MSKEIFVIDQQNHRIQVFGLDGTFKRKWGSYGTGDGFLNYPQGIFIYADEVFVSDSLNCRVQVFGLDGTFKRIWGSLGTGDGQFKYPVGLDIPVGKIQYLPVLGIG